MSSRQRAANSLVRSLGVGEVLVPALCPGAMPVGHRAENQCLVNAAQVGIATVTGSCLRLFSALLAVIQQRRLVHA